MTGFIRYQFISYIRSLKMIPPVTLFFVWIILFYTYSGVPIFSSYSVSSITIYLVATWLTMTVFSIEEEGEKNLLFVQLNSKSHYLWGKWIICLLFSSILTGFAIFYPIILNSFIDSIKPIHLGLTFFSHFLLAGFGVLVGSFFSITSFVAKKYTWLLALLVILLSLSYEGLVEDVSFLKWVLIFLPPVTHVIQYLNGEEIIQIDNEFWFLVTYTIAYSLLGIYVILKLFLKKER